jgi:predicted amidohydrolase YtcJ
VVAVHDPGALSLQDGLGAGIAAYRALDERGDLPIRVHAAIRSEQLAAAADAGLRSGDPLGPPGGRARFGWLKLFADGTLASRTAALLEPIEGGSERGMFTTPPDVLRERATKAAAAGIATQIHAIGDAAVRTSLDVLGPTVSKVKLMPRLEHIQLCHPDDRARFAALGVGASVQPVHLRDDAATARRDWGARAESGGYTWRSLLDAGAVLGFGTDAPVEPIDPWPGVAMAVLRRDPSWGADAPPYGPDEALTLEQALRAATVGPATFARDPLGGRLIPGSRADLIVLPAAPREADERVAAFAEVRPRLVIVDGDIVVER